MLFSFWFNIMERLFCYNMKLAITLLLFVPLVEGKYVAFDFGITGTLKFFPYPIDGESKN